ncbi:MAG: sugar phosphate isomerase/epimerase [Verrucomicrobia bacterium]|nr:sugar phosphate isomerase/epimerase [Verrucomicrobiota bacterium]
MRYALNASTIRPTPLTRKIEIAARAGYAGIELWHDEIEAALAVGSTLSDLRRQLDESGLRVPTTIYLGGWFEATPATYPAALEHCRRRMEHAATLGAEFIIASPPPDRADYRLGASRYAELLSLGRQIGVRPSMEFLGFVGQLNTIEEALSVLDLAGDPQGTTILDPFHIYRGGGSMDSILKLRAEQIAVSHFNDTPSTPSREKQHDRDRVMPGEGHLDLPRYLRGLRQTGYQGWLSLELFNEVLWQQDPLEVARTGLDKMKSLAEA